MKNPIIGCILLYVFGYFISSFGPWPVSILISAIGYPDNWVRYYVIGAILTIIYCVILRILCKEDFVYSANRSYVTAVVLGELLVFLLAAVNIIVQWLNGAFEFNFTVSNFILALSVAVTEELVYRVIPIMYLMRYRARPTLVVTVTALIFGFVHFENIIHGAEGFSTIMQILFAIAVGVLMSAVFLRTGNTLILILAHFLNDFLVFSMETTVSNSFVSEADIQSVGISASTLVHSLMIFSVKMILYFVIAVIGFLLIYKKERQIYQLWDSKWRSDTLRKDVGECLNSKRLMS